MRSVIAAIAAVVLSAHALAAESFPNRSITLVVAAAAGGTTDVLARIVARQYRTQHNEIVLTEGAREATERALRAFPEPFGDSSAVPTLEVFRAVAREVKVVLTGDGGDELFAGYDRYRMVEALPSARMARPVGRWLEHLPSWSGVQRLRRAARVVGARPADRYRALLEVFSFRERRALLGDDAGVARLVGEANTDVDTALGFDLGVYLPDDLLLKTDIASMHWGLEARCPLLDQALAEQVIPLPARYKQDTRQGKLLLRAAVADLLPPEILARGKRGFGSPAGEWLRGPLRSMLGDLVESPRSPVRDWLAGPAIDRTLRSVLRGAGNEHQAWALLALGGWLAARKDRAEGTAVRSESR